MTTVAYAAVCQSGLSFENQLFEDWGTDGIDFANSYAYLVRADENGTLIHDLGDYPKAMRELADYRGVRLLDIEQAMKPMLQELGAEGSKALYTWVEKGHPNYPDGREDDVHLCFTGAVRVAPPPSPALSTTCSRRASGESAS